MPLPATESLSVSAPTLYLSVSCRPFNRSTRKKRFSFSMNFDLGTLTKGIITFPIADCRSFTCRGSDCPHCWFTLWNVHQLDVPALTLQIKVARTPVEPCQQQSRNSQAGKSHRYHDGFAARS